MPKKKLAKLRQQAFIRQGGRCFYCDSPMCAGDPEQFAKRYDCSVQFARHLLCTAEHLSAKRDGGEDIVENIVAACMFCNRTRHRFKKALQPEAYRRHVKARLRRGRWHPSVFHTRIVPLSVDSDAPSSC